MKREDVRKYFWEELNAYTLNNHHFQDGFKELVNASIERAIIRAQNKGRTIEEIINKKITKKDDSMCKCGFVKGRHTGSMSKLDACNNFRKIIIK